MDIDQTPRYAPNVVMTSKGNRPVKKHIVYPYGGEPKGCPIKPDRAVLECRTEAGSRWYGIEAGWINSELRMVVRGFPARFEEMASWPVCARP